VPDIAYLAGAQKLEPERQIASRIDLPEKSQLTVDQTDIYTKITHDLNEKLNKRAQSCHSRQGGDFY
jgi:hypothetical protein